MLDTYLVAMSDAEQYLSFLHSLSDMGAAMRSVITAAVTNPHIYTNLCQGTASYLTLMSTSISSFSKGNYTIV